MEVALSSETLVSYCITICITTQQTSTWNHQNDLQIL